MSYRVSLCGTCAHPAGQHRGGGDYACVLCECTAWVENGVGMWNDEMTDAARAASS